MCFVLWAFISSCHASGINILRPFDEIKIIHEHRGEPQLSEQFSQIEKIRDCLLAHNKDELLSVFTSSPKPSQTQIEMLFSMPLAETDTIVTGGSGSLIDQRPDSMFTSFHIVGDIAALRFWYKRDSEAQTPYTVRIFLKKDDTFPELTADNFDKRLAWEKVRLDKLHTEINAQLEIME